jgi:tetratricopeptide (TPR) repeat protein
MAPEQVRGERVDARADVFAFGVILHELLAGQLPFAGPTPIALAFAVTVDTPAPLARPDAPGLVALATRCIERDPARRPADGRALVELLGALFGSGPVSGPMPGAPTAAAPPTPAAVVETPPAGTTDLSSPETVVGRRGRRVAGVAVGAVLVAAGVGVALRVAQVGPFATPEVRLRALLEDPKVPIACLPFTASGDIAARELGLVAGASACEVMETWLWSAERVRSPAALLHLQKSGDATSDVFFSDEGRAALVAATVDAPIVVEGGIHVDREGTHLTWRVSVRGGGVVEAKSTAATFLLATDAVARRFMEQVGVSPRALPDDERRIFGLTTGSDYMAFSVLAARPVKDEATCASLASVAPRLAALFHAEACGHPERTPEGLPAWPPGALNLTGATDVERAWVQVRVVAQPAPEQARSWAATLHAGRATASSMLAGELAGVEGMALVKAGDIDGARAAFDVAIESWPNNGEAWFGRLGLEQEAGSLARSMSVWFPVNSTTWAYRADEDGDGSDAIAMHELKYYLDDRIADSVLNLAERLVAARAVGRLQALASFHRDRGRPGDASTAAFLLALSEAADGRVQAAFERLRTLTLGADRFAWSTVFAVTHALGAERLLGRTGLADALLERFVLSETVPVEPAMDAELFGPLLGAASPAVGTRAVAALRGRLEKGTLQTGPRTHVTLEGFARYFAGDAKGAAAVWRRLADVYGSQLSAKVFEEAGEHDLAERRHRMYVDRSPDVATYAHAMLARHLAARGALAEARALAELFVARYTRTDVPIPLVEDMKALLRDHPAPAP